MELVLQNQTKRLTKSTALTELVAFDTLTHVLHNLHGARLTVEKHSLMDGRLHVYRREGSRFWQCSTYLNGRNHRETTKEESLVLAKEFASIWYMKLFIEERRRRTGLALPLNEPVRQPVADTGAPADGRRRRTPSGPTFEDAAEVFTREFEIITQGERNTDYVAQKTLQLNVHLLPFFGGKAVSDVTAAMVQDYRVHRLTSRLDKQGKPKRPSRSTLHGEMVTLRQVLKTANRKGWIDALPDMSTAYKSSGKVEHRAWFSPEEYKILYEHTRERAKNPPKERWREVWEKLP